jgi:hypothetical protein
MCNPAIGTGRLWVIGVTLVSALVLAVPAALAAPPANDAFASARALGASSGDLAATSADATKEAGEPAHAGNPGGASVWFRLTPERTGRMTVFTRQISFDTVLAVYTGTTVGGLTEIASNNDYGATSHASRVTFPVVPGTNYFIAVDGVGGASGSFSLRWRQGPANDEFADAVSLTGAAGSVKGTVYQATSEPGELLQGAGATVWYSWIAPEDGRFGLLLGCGCHVATVYTGASVDTLEAVASGEQIAFSAVAGTEYSIAVEGDTRWDFSFKLAWGKSPANDNLEDAQVIAGRSGTVAGTDAFATLEPDERRPRENTVWYSWTAPRTESVRFEIDRETVTHDTFLSVFEGTSIDTLDPLKDNDDFLSQASGLSIQAKAGTTYLVRVSGLCCSEMGEFDLDWYPGTIILARPGADTLNGTPGRDYIDGGRGNDVIHGLGGNDVIVGSSGRDRLFGDGGADSLNSRDFTRGNDVIFGGPGTDTAVRDRRDGLHGVP